MEIKFCEYGCGKEALYQIKNGKWCCSKSPNSCSINRLKNSEKLKANHPRGMAGKRPWNYGKKWIEKFGIDGWNDIKNRMYITRKNNGKLNTWNLLTEEQKIKHREKQSLAINNRYKNGWMPKAGRCKKIQYERLDKKVVFLDGFWELLTSIYFDYMEFNWERNTTRFEYFNEIKQRKAYYTPDFYLPDTNEYIEVKGYEDELAKCKKRQFTGILKMIKLDEIKNIEEFLRISVSTLQKILINEQIKFSEIQKRLNVKNIPINSLNLL